MRSIIGTAALGLYLATAPASAQQLQLTIETIDHPAFSARNLSLKLSVTAAEAHIDELRLAGREWHDVRLSCAEAQWSVGAFACPRGQIKLPGAEAIPLSMRYEQASGVLDLTLKQAPLVTLARLMPELAAWMFDGRVDATVQLTARSLTARLRTTELGFSDTAGTHAGEHLGVTADFFAQEVDTGTWDWNAKLQWTTGGSYWQPLYLKAEGQTLAAHGRYDGETLRVEGGNAALAALGKAEFAVAWNLKTGVLENATATITGMDLALAGATLLQPFLDQAALPKLKLGGSAGVTLEYAAGGVQRIDVDLADVSLSDDDGSGSDTARFALNGVNAHIPWRRDAATQVEFSAAGGSLERLPLGPFSLPLRMNGFEFDLARTEVALLDGKLLLENFHASRLGDDWHWQVAGTLQPVSMPFLTERLGLPRMNGMLAATIPKIAYVDKTLALDGALIISVFDGYLSATGLQVVDPLGRAPRLEANLEMRHLDLGMLTQTFSFGDITGYIDADVKGLELVRWRPQQFAASVYSSPGSYRRRISQRAVQNISSLGGAGAAAAIQRSFLGFFETFGYDRIGLSCTLSNGVCTMGGIEAAPQGYVIVKGGGIPALTVIGYNRQVQWDELLNRLQAVIQGNARPVIH